MLEKYITPLLMSYVDKYIKNLSPNDLGVSLWGGDVLLKNLELKLDVLEQEFLFPVKFLSGRIHELKIHIPWTSLGSDSVVITLNTLECSLTYRPVQETKRDVVNSAEDDEDKESDSGISDASGQQAVAPSYVQLLTQRILNNVEIHVNNLIFKYIEDDIVLSVNIKSACMYTVNEEWTQAFSDITAPEFSLRRVIELVDLTICLDRNSASGRIEVYEEPVLYRAHINCRSLFTFPNAYSFSPSAIFVHVLCDDINLNISDQQFPAMIVLLRRLYYLTNSSDTTKQVVHPAPPPVMSADEEGWIGWGWSMLGMATYDDYRVSPAPPAEMLFNFSFFVKSFNISCTQVLHQRRKRSAKYQFAPFLNVKMRGLALECVAKGYYYSHFTVGVCGLTAHLSHHNERIFVLGDAEADSSKLVAGSLFDSQTELEYEDKRHATEDETLKFTQYRALYLCMLNIIPEFKQRPLDELDRLERNETEIFEIRMLVNKFTVFLNNSILSSLCLFFNSKTMSAMFDPLPEQPNPKRAVSTTRLHVMSHLSVTCLGATVFLSGSNVREGDGTHPVCMFYTCARVDLDQHAPLWVSQLTKLGPQHSLTNKLCYCNYAIRVTDNSVGFCSVRDLQTLSTIVILPATFVQTVIRVYCYPQGWVSAMQGLLEVRLEVPQITLMLTMPQVYLTSHFASYWTNKFLGGGGEEDLLHGSALRTLSQQALDIEEQLSVELCVSNIGVKFCQTTVVNSAMLTLRGAELFLYKSTDDAVCVLSGPYFTKDVFRFLEQPSDVHVIPSLLSVTVQWPHVPFTTSSTPSDRPVLIVHSSGVVVCWDNALPALLAYRPPVNSGVYVRSCSLESMSVASSTPASSTAPSSHAGDLPIVFTTPVTTPSALRAGTTISDSPPAPETPPLDDVTARGGDVTGSRPSSRYSTPESVGCPRPTVWDVVEYLAVQVNISPIVLLLSSAGCGSPQGDVLEYVQNTPCLDAVLLCLPAVLITNETTTCGLITPQELPLSVTTTGGLVGTPTEYKTLPWKISLSNLAVSTVSQSLSPLLDPVSLDVVLALGSRGSNDICLHADTHPISVAVRLEQIRLVLRVVDSLTRSFEVVGPVETHNPLTAQISTTGSEVSSIHTYLPDLTYVTSPEDNIGGGTPYLYVWLQYAIPKITVTLDDTLKLEAEDITASMDMEGLLLTKKLKIGNLSLSIMDKEETTLLQSACSDPVLSVVHCNNYMRDSNPSFFIKIKPMQVVLDSEAVFKLLGLLEQSSDFQRQVSHDTRMDHITITPTTLNTASYPDVRMEIQDLEIICPVAGSLPNKLFDNELVCHVSLMTVSSNPDNLLSRVIVDKGYHRHIKSTDTHSRCNYQLQIELTGLEVYSDKMPAPDTSQSITNAAEAWGQRKLSSGDEISATIIQSLDLRITYAPSVLATRSGNQFGIYGTSVEVHVEPLKVQLALDQIELLLQLSSQYSHTSNNKPKQSLPDRKTSEKSSENPDKLNKLDCYEAMFALNHLTVLLYERVIPESPSGVEISGISGSVEPDLVSVAEYSVEQGVVSACSLPSGDEIRASLFTATIAIATDRQGVRYDGDLKCPVKVFSTVPPNRHTPFLTLCRQSNKNNDKVKVEIKHDIEVEAEISYLEPILSTVEKITALNFGKEAVPTGTTSSTSTPSTFPCDSVTLHVQRSQVRLGELQLGFRYLDMSLGKEKNDTIRTDVELSGVHVSTRSDSSPTDLAIVLPCDVKITSQIDPVRKGVVNSVYLPCLYGKLGQEHVRVLETLAQQVSTYLPATKEEKPAPAAPFTTYHHDDIRSAGYKFVILESDKQHTVAPGTVVFSANEAAITWRYPEKRSIVSMVTLPVLLACEQNDGIQCTLLYYDEFTKSYKPYVEFAVSQVDVATYKLPSNGIEAYQWRVHMELDVEIWEEKSSGSDHTEHVVLDWKDVELSSYPALSLAGCLCVDSVSTKVPLISTSLYISELEFLLLHHNLDKTGLTVRDLPLVLPDRELELLKLSVRNLSAKADMDTALSVQLTCGFDLHYLDYSSLLYTLLSRSQLYLEFVSRDKCQAQDVTHNVTVLSKHPTKTTVSVRLDATCLSLSPSLLSSLHSVKKSWVDRQDVYLFETFVVNETTHSAQLMLNGGRYLGCHGNSVAACYWNPAQPVFVALETIHPSWSKAMSLKTGSVVEDDGVFVVVEREGSCNYIRITGGLCVNNRTVLDLQCSFLPLDPSRGETTYTTLKVQSVGAKEMNKSYILGSGEHAMSLGLTSGTVQWSQPVRLHKDLPESFVVTLNPECYIVVSVLHNSGHFTVTLDPLFIVRNNFAEELLISLSSPEQGISKTVKLPGYGTQEQIFSINQTSYHNIGCKLNSSLPLSMPVSSLNYRLLDKLPRQSDQHSWPSSILAEPAGCEVRSILVPHSEIPDWSMEAEIHFSRDCVSNFTMCVDWWPGCIVLNNTNLTVSVRGSLSTPPVRVQPVSYRSTFSIKGQLYVGVEETEGDTVWSTMINVAAKAGDTEVFREVHITGQEQVCHVIVHCEYKGSVAIVTIKPPLVLSVKLPQLYIRLGDKVVFVEEEEYNTELYWWNDKVMLEMAYKQQNQWSFPLDLTSLVPRKGINVQSEKPSSPLPVVVCSVDHAATTYVAVSLNTSPQIYLTNHSEFEFIVSERLPPTLTTKSVTVDGDKTLLLKPFRSCYFDPFSTTDKLFIQDINENDFIPQLSFAFYKRSQEIQDSLINSHKIELNLRSRDQTAAQADSDPLEIINIDSDNNVAIRVQNEGSLVTVSIMSEFMVESRRTLRRGLSRDCDVTPTSYSYWLSASQVDVFLFTQDDILASQIRLSDVQCSLSPDSAPARACSKSGDNLASRADTTHVTSQEVEPCRQAITFVIGDIQLDNSLRDQTYDYPVVLFTDKAVRSGSQSVTATPEPFLQTSVTFNPAQNSHSIHHFLFQLGKIHLHLEDLFLYQLMDVAAQFAARAVPPPASSRTGQPEVVVPPQDMPGVVVTLMSELYEPLTIDLFSISDIDIELGVHASVKLFLAADQIPLKFKSFRVRKLFTLTEHFSQVIVAKYLSDTVFQAGWALASLDLLGSPGVMIRSTLTGVKDLVVMPYDGLTRGPTAFVSGIAAGSASFARNIGTGVITSVTNLAVSISRNMDKMSLDEGHRRLCAIHRRSYKASHFGSGLSKGLTGLGLNLLSAVAGLVHQPMQDIGDSEGLMGATKGLVTGVSKGLVGMVTKPLGGAAELVANTGEGLLTGAGWTLAPNPLVPDHKHLLKSDTRIRVSLELLQLTTADAIHLVQCTVNPIVIYVVISRDKIFLLLDSIIQCFSRSSVRFLFEQSNVAIYSTSSADKDEDTSKLDKSLLDKINKMYNLPTEPAPSENSSDLIATLPLDFPKSVLLKNLLSRE
ncbi:hypothetical protein ACHWQZ_G019214 [Mnemiopsis leidyi]